MNSILTPTLPNNHNENDVVIQNGGNPKNRTGGFQRYTTLVESIRTSYKLQKKKREFVIDKVIIPLLDEGRHFYIGDRNCRDMILLNLDKHDRNSSDMIQIAKKTQTKVRDANRDANSSSSDEDIMPELIDSPVDSPNSQGRTVATFLNDHDEELMPEIVDSFADSFNLQERNFATFSNDYEKLVNESIHSIDFYW
jgi:hypothetical protein